MSHFPDSEPDTRSSTSPAARGGGDRVDSLVAWIDEIDARLRVAEVATGDEKAAKELRKAVEAAAKHDPKLEERLGNRVDVLADRLASLSTTVSTTAAALARKDGEIAALRRELDEGKAQIDAASRQARASSSNAEIDELRKAVASVSEQKLPKKIDDRIDDVKASVGVLAQRLETLSSTVSTTAAGLAGREGEVAALRRTLEEGRAAAEAEIAKLRSAIDPAPIAELREAVKHLSGETSALKRDGQRRLDGVTAGLDNLAQRIDAVASTLGATTQALAMSDERSAGLRAEFDEESTRVDSLLVKLHEATSELSARVAELGGVATSDAVDALGADVAEIAQRVEDLGSTVTATAAGYADREYEIAALSRRFEEISTQVDAGVRELRASVESMADHGVDPALESRIEDVARGLDAVAGRIETVDSSVSTGWSAASQAVAAIDHRLAEVAQRLESVESDPELESRVVEVGQEVSDLASRLGKIDAATSAGWGEASKAIAALEQRLAGVTQRLDAADDGRTHVLAEVAHASEAWATERGTLVEASRELEERVAALGASLDESRAGIASLQETLETVDEGSSERELELQALGKRFEEASARVDGLVSELRTALETMPTPVPADATDDPFSDLAGRLDALEQGRATIALEIARAAASWSDERTSLRDELTALQSSLQSGLDDLAAVRDTPSSGGGEVPEERIADIAERLERSEREREALAAEIAGATSFWSSGLGALEARLAEVASARQESERKLDDEVVRALFDVARRLDAVEREHAAADAEVARTAESWAVDRESLSAGLDAVTRRLDSLDSGGVGTTDASARGASDDPSDGRFRLELRALELRMEHAEAAARENREAVLVQLERLASRIEWRLQRLETGGTDDPLPEVASGPLAQVVRIHGSDA